MSAASIPRIGSFPSSSSFDSPPHSAPSLTAQGRHRSPRSAAAQHRRAARPSPLPVRAAAGEVHCLLLFVVRAFPGLLWPRLAPPPLAVAAHAVSARTSARAGRAVGAHAPGQGRPACLDLAGGRLPVGPTCRPLAWQVWLPRVDLAIVARVSLGLFVLQTSKIHRNSCVAPKIMKLVLLDSSSLDLLKKNIFLHVTLL